MDSVQQALYTGHETIKLHNLYVPLHAHTVDTLPKRFIPAHLYSCAASWNGYYGNVRMMKQTS